MKNKVRNVILVLIVIFIAAFYAIGDWETAIYVRTASSGDDSLTNELTGDIEVKQSFLCPDNGFDGLTVKLLKVGSEEVDGYSWELTDQEGSLVAGGKITPDMLNARKFVTKKILTLEIPKQENSKNCRYTFILYGNNVNKEGCLQAYKTERGTFAEELSIDGKNDGQALVLKMQTHKFNLETFLVFLGLALYVGVFFRFMYKLFR